MDKFIAINFGDENYKIKISKLDWNEIKKDLNNNLFDHIILKMLERDYIIHLLSAMRLKGFTTDENHILENVKTFIEDEQFHEKLIRILDSIGIGKNIDILDSKTHGDLGEYIMNIVINEIFESNKVDVIIPKIICKTTRGMPVFGEDNIYYSKEENVIYLGEAKFYTSLHSGLKNATNGINERIESRDAVTYIDSHSLFIKSATIENYSHLLELIESDNLVNENTIFRGIIFIICQDKYRLQDIEKKVKEFNFRGIIIILPIISKQLFLERYKEYIDEY